MAEDKLVFPIGFDIEDGEKKAIRDWRNAQKRIQRVIDDNVLDVKIDSRRGLADFAKEMQKLGTKNGLKVIQKQLEDLSNEFEKIDISERFVVDDKDSISKLSKKTEDLISRYTHLISIAEQYGKSLSQYSKEAVRELNAQNKAMEAKQRAEEKEVQRLEKAIAKDKQAAREKLAREKEVAEKSATNYSQWWEKAIKERELKEIESSKKAALAREQEQQKLFAETRKDAYQSIGEPSFETEKMKEYYAQMETNSAKAYEDIQRERKASSEYWEERRRAATEALTADSPSSKDDREYYAELERLSDERLANEKSRIAQERKASSEYWNERRKIAVETITAESTPSKSDREYYAQLEKESQERQKQIDLINEKHRLEQTAKNAFIQSYRQRIKILQNEEKTIEDINAKLRLQQERLKSAKIDSNKFNKINNEVQRLTTKLQDVQKRMGAINTSPTNKLSNGLGVVNQAYSRQLTYVERLIERAGVYGAIFATQSIIRNIREVTAEFELQRVSLAAMIGEAGKADTLFAKTVAAAVESPFQIKDLVKYTKQLAAFGVKYNKLFDTTQQLADISAGLGADYGRLALAYGQIRARGFLAGTELKQLTELGLAFPEMLAEELSKTRNMAVSVADVFDMISRREITFGAVENIFEKLTSDGGRFYKMQQKQAKTLAGLWSNLKDTIDIAYSEIGTEYYDKMKGGIEILHKLIENWESLAKVMKVAAITTSYLWARKKLLASTQQKFTKALGKEAVEEYSLIKATQEKIREQKRLNALTNSALKERKLKITDVDTSDKELIRRAIATKTLTKEEATRAIILNQTTKAERNMMIQTKLLTAEQVKAALAMRTTAKGGNLLQRAIKGIKSSFKDLSETISKFFKSNWIALLISAIIAVISEWIAKNKEMRAEMDRLIDKQKELHQELKSIDDDALLKNTKNGVEKLKEVLEDMGVSAKRALANLKPDASIEEQYNTLANKIEVISKNAIILSTVLTKGFSDLELGGLLGENIKTDMEQFNKSIAKLFSGRDIEADLLEFRKELARQVKSLSKEEQDRFKNLLDGIRVYEKEEDYLLRLAKAYSEFYSASRGTGVSAIDIFDEDYLKNIHIFSDIFRTLTTEQQNALYEMSDAYKDAISDINEFGYEIDKRISEIASKLNIQELINKGDKKGIQDIVFSIQAVLADPEYKLSDMAKQIGEKLIAEKLNIPIEFTTIIDDIDIESLTTIQQVLSASKLFYEGDVKNIHNLVEAHKILQDVLNKETELKEIIKKADRESYDERMAQYKEIAKREKKQYEDKLRLAEEQIRGFLPSSEEYKKTELIIKQLQKQITEYENEIDSYGISFDDFVKNSANNLKQYEENSKKAFKTADALGVLIAYMTKKGGGSGQDPFIILMKNRMSFMKDFQKGVETLSEYMEELTALSQEQDVMRSRGVSIGLDVQALKGTSEELLQWYDDTIQTIQTKLYKMGGGIFKENTIQAILSTDTKSKTIKAYQDLLQSVFNAKTDFNLDVLKKNLTSKLSQIKEDIKQAQARENFFEDILGATGDTSLAEKLTESVFGKLGQSLQDSIKEQIQVAFGGDLFKKEVEKAISGDTIDYNALEGLIDKLPEAYRKVAKEMVDEGKKTNAADILNLTKSLAKFKEYEVRKTEIRRKGEEERKNIRELYSDSEVREEMITASKTKEKEELTKVDVEAFKNTDDYIKAFQDLDKLSTQSINRIIAKLQEFLKINKASMSTEEINNFQNAIEKLIEKGVERNPFTNIISSLKKWKAINKDITKSEKDKKDAVKGVSAELTNSISALDNYQNQINELTSGISDMMKMFGASEEDVQFFEDIISGLNEVFDASQQLGQGIIKLSSGDIFGGIMDILNSIPKFFKGISQLFKAKAIRDANKAIKTQEKLIEDLSYTYGRLEKAAKDALGTDAIDNYNDRYENLLAQQAAAEKKARKERSKGKSEDKKKTEEYKKEARDAKDAAADLAKEFSEEMFGLNLASFSKELAKIWLDAKLAGEDTFDALNKKWKETMKDMVANTILAQYVQSMMKPVFDYINQLSEDPSLISDPKFWKGLDLLMGSTTGGINTGLEYLYEIFKKYGIDFNAGTSDLKGISKDIANASEESILGLAAGINTQNFYISGIKQDTAMIVALLQGGGLKMASQVDTAALIQQQNTYLQHLPNIANNTANTVAECKNIVIQTKRLADRLDQVVKPVGSAATGYTIKVSY